MAVAGKELWEASFEEQIALQAYNTAPVEAVIRTVAYYFRSRYQPDQLRKLRFLEMGCGAGPNLQWLAGKGVRVSGVDISATALGLAHKTLGHAGLADRVDRLVEASVGQVPFEDGHFDGIVEACVFQHLPRDVRLAAFAEVKRLLKPGGLFVGYMLESGHTLYQAKRAEELPDDPGTLLLQDGSSKVHLSNLGLCHFYRRGELEELLAGFATVDPCLTTYYLPREEARKRGYDQYLQSMWTVYAVR
jgi:SAM-dependent methyltransferase